MVQNDITREYELNVQLNYQASHDALTDLINRAEFERRMKRLLSEKTTPDIRHAFCFMDLDQFKIINDTCGHHAGDQLLRQIAQLLQTSVRKRDTLARLGGDEFALLMEHCSLDKAQDVAYAMLDSVKDYRFYWKGQTFQIGISIGLVEIEPSSATVEEFMKQADAACYVAKRLGRNRIHLYCPDDTELVRRYGEVHWLGLINKAFNEDHFKLYAQPIRSFGNNPEHVHYELLLRMQGDDGEIITPERFLPAAERYGLMPKLDSWVIETALNKLAESAAFMSRVEFVSINLSGASMSDNNILKVIESAINRSCYAPDKFCFEITETAAISNMVAAVEMANNLKALGCRLALDDFGTGLSSFSYLKSLPVDLLKIDGLFIKDIANDSFNEAMVKSINDISHVMHIKTIAKFVEDVETSDMLQMMGVDYGQGFYLGRPELLDDLIARTKTC
jgi:diguanylate cyclase (GGDEF)-like protein